MESLTGISPLAFSKVNVPPPALAPVRTTPDPALMSDEALPRLTFSKPKRWPVMGGRVKVFKLPPLTQIIPGVNLLVTQHFTPPKRASIIIPEDGTRKRYRRFLESPIVRTSCPEEYR